MTGLQLLLIYTCQLASMLSSFVATFSALASLLLQLSSFEAADLTVQSERCTGRQSDLEFITQTHCLSTACSARRAGTMASMPGAYRTHDEDEIDLPVTEDEAYSPSAEGS